MTFTGVQFTFCVIEIITNILNTNITYALHVIDCIRPVIKRIQCPGAKMTQQPRFRRIKNYCMRYDDFCCRSSFGSGRWVILLRGTGSMFIFHFLQCLIACYRLTINLKVEIIQYFNQPFHIVFII